MFPIKFRRIALVVFLLFFISQSFAQYIGFGQNKLQYEKFKWHYIQSEHFDVYFYPGGYEAAIYTANMAESSYVHLRDDFRFEITARIRIILYKSHNDFQQTNVVDEYMVEGIGGVTELYKNRVVIPFEGSYAQLKHVLHHELVHAVMNDMLYGGSVQGLVAGTVVPVPLWFAEGLAEYLSLGWDTRADMILRDATISGYLPPLEYLNYYMVYQGGQSVFRYIAQKYGHEKISEILHKIKGSFRFDAAMNSALGIKLEDLSEEWQKQMRKEYWPDIADRLEPKEIARQITKHREDENYLNISPALSPLGDKMLMLSDRDGKQSIYLVDILENKIVDKLIQGETSVDFEELHWLSPGMSWSPDGNKIAFSAKAGDQDALYIYDIANESIKQNKFNLDGVFSASWSPTGDKIAFSGHLNGSSDIYIYEIKNDDIVKVTDDIFSDSEPVWSSDGSKIAFISDRGGYAFGEPLPEKFLMSAHDVNNTDVYIIDADGSNGYRVTDTPHRESSPVFSPDGKKLMYVSDRTGIYNIYIREFETGREYPVTNLLTGAFQLSIDKEGKTLAFASFNFGGWDIFTLKNPFELEEVEVNDTEYFKRLEKEKSVLASEEEKGTDLQDDYVQIPKTSDYSRFVFADLDRRSKKKSADVELKEDDYKLEDGNYKVRNYRVRFSPDIVNGAAQYNTLWGFQGYTQMAFSDVLGNHRIYVGTNLVFDLRNSHISVEYWYLPHRTNFGINGYHFANTYMSYYYGLTRIRDFGAYFIASRPFNRFMRLDFSLNFENVRLEYLQVPWPTERLRSLMPALQLVYDTAEWGWTGPAGGFRGALVLNASPGYDALSPEFTTIKADLRKYFKLSDNYSFAFRLAGAFSEGSTPQNFFLGGVDYWLNRSYSNSDLRNDYITSIFDFSFSEFVTPLRGVSYYDRIGNAYGLLNMEFRFPLINILQLGLPPITFGNIRGVLFTDVGTTFTTKSTDSQKAYKWDPVDGDYFKDVVAGIGYGTRIVFLGLLFKYDIAYRVLTPDLNEIGRPVHYLSLGIDF
ncbi:MAG: PD40 domain-containing protein [Calditrichaceae bacterium]|nr:PD40 domain-containing protein [Calditrichaceae bacterium]MBN2707860.1 PD40 domain-containing protein [Calditrichaceae bacterium]